MKKKILALILVMCFVLSFSGYAADILGEEEQPITGREETTEMQTTAALVQEEATEALISETQPTEGTTAPVIIPPDSSDPRSIYVRVWPFLDYISSSKLRLTLEITGMIGTTKIGFRDVALYKYTGTYWAWVANYPARSNPADYNEYVCDFFASSTSLGTFTSGQYKASGTGFCINCGNEYTTAFEVKLTV